MYKKTKKVVSSCMIGTMLVSSVFSYGAMLPSISVYAAGTSVVSDATRAEIEASLYDFEYYTMANEDVVVSLRFLSDIK